MEFADFLQSYLNRVEPLSREVNLAYWQATISGKAADFDRFADLQVQLQKIYSNRSEFEQIKKWRDGSEVADPLDRRQIELLHNAYLRNQIDSRLNEKLTKLGSKIENQFNVYRARINGKSVTSNDILKILKDSPDTSHRRGAWNAAKAVGGVVEKDLLKLIELRNEAAGSLGYDNYYSMSLELNEQKEDDIVAIFDELEKKTRRPFKELKEDLDLRLAKRFRIKPSELRPWHYEDPFFQEAPQVFELDLDRYYADARILDLVTAFFGGIGLDVADILERSDLYEKPGKDQHAYCTDIDRKGDIRILANIKSDETWTGTMLHELGHAVHDKYIDMTLPYVLRQEAHIFTTEAIAMMFGRLSKDPNWIQNNVGISNSEKESVARESKRNLRLSQLVFARWSQVMMNFERQLYHDPSQDLDRIWWDLVEKYQMMAAPGVMESPSWAAKTHVVSVPVYYHNYLLGEVLASQLSHNIRENVLPSESRNGSFCGHEAVGEYLKQKVFEPGARRRWDQMVENATGEPLTSRYFIDEFVS